LKKGNFEEFKTAASALNTIAARLGVNIAKIASDQDCVARLAPLKEPLMQLCALYLLRRPDAGEPAQDPVARFHLNNGASLERIDWLADTSRKGLRESLGLMVNYLYEPRAIESNHEKFVRGEFVASRRVRGLASG
ncbi:MAG TPA: malonyl-CoA decarboxylase family protein, partial [Terriglobales bacterium]